MHRILTVIIALIAFVMIPSMVFSQTTGKIRGTVVDNESGEPLVGAAVSVNGTTFGAATDANGVYIILAVPVGQYSISARYIGYNETKVSNVRVLAGLTTELNMKLSSSAVQVKEVNIIAERPLVNKSMTNTESVVDASDIKNMPLRGVQALTSIAPGVVTDATGVHFRGGRADEVQTYVDGVPVNNPMTGTSASINGAAPSLTVINNAIEEVSTEVGGMTAEYGNAMSGIVNVTTKTGGPTYTGSFEANTDNLGGVNGKNALGTYSYGLNQYAATFGGPLVPGQNKVKFFFAAQHDFNRTNPSFLDGISFPHIDSTQVYGADWAVNNRGTDSAALKNAATGSTGNRTYIANLLNSTAFQGGRGVAGAALDDYAFSGNVYVDMGSLNLKIGGTYTPENNIAQMGRGFNVIQDVAGYQNRGQLTDQYDASGYIKGTYFMDPVTYLTVQGNVWQFYSVTEDPILKGDLEDYGNYKIPENSGLLGPSLAPPTPSLFGSFGFNYPGNYYDNSGTGTGLYQKVSRNQLGARADLVRQFSKSYELKLGGEYNYYTIRTYSINAFDIALLRVEHPGASDYEIYNLANISNYGYDIYGQNFAGGSFTDKTGFTANQSDEGPRHPYFAGAYVQNKVEMSDLIVNFGVRFDAFNSGAQQYKDPANIGYDSLQIVSDTSLTSPTTYTQVSPRIGLSFPVTDNTVFHAEFGKFMAEAALNNYYDTRTVAGRFFAGGYARNFPNPNLKPERTTDYELGFLQTLSDNAEFDITGFYKDIQDLFVERIQITDPTAPERAYIQLDNGDFGTTEGFQLRFHVRRTNRIEANLNYTLQSSVATGSTSLSHFNIAWQDNTGPGGTAYFPTIVQPTDQDRTHSGNIMLDYRYADDDGPSLFGSKILQRAGLNLLFTFSSGVRYTLTQPTGAFGFSNVNGVVPYETLNASEGPWNLRLDLRLDKEFNVQSHLFDVYLWVQNVFNRKNIIQTPYTGTGSATDDGWLSTPSGQTWSNQNGPTATALYQYLDENLGLYDTPRVVRVGVSVTL